jgi:hypothetical protein
MQLGQLIFGRPGAGDKAYYQGQALGAQVVDRLDSARRARAAAMIDEDRLNGRSGITPQALQDAGYSADEAPLLGSILHSNDKVTLADLGQLAIPTAGADLAAASQAARSGDVGLENRLLTAAQGKPVKTTDLENGLAYNPYGAPGQDVNVTPLGQAVIGKDRAAAAKSMAETVPTAQRNFQFYERLTPDQQKLYSQMAGHNGNGTTVYDPSTGNPLVQIGGSPGPLTTANRTAVQKDLMGAQDEIATLRQAGQQMRDEYLTATGRGKAMLGSVLDKAGIGGPLARFNADRSQALLGVEQFFNAYRKEITGAAAAEQELRALRKASLDGSVGPEEFWARYDGLMGLIESGLHRNQARLGLPTGGLGEQVMGAGAQAPEAPGLGAQAMGGASAPALGQGAGNQAAAPRQAPDGHFYVPDPNRPGKYLRVDD